MTEPASTKGVMVLLHLEAPESVSEQVRSVYQRLNPQLFKDAPGLQSSILAKALKPEGTETLLIVSCWRSLEEYQEWESGEHRKDLRPLVSLVDGLRPETFVCVA
jgi:heme-degrading monooxygenase HmoA